MTHCVKTGVMRNLALVAVLASATSCVYGTANYQEVQMNAAADRVEGSIQALRSESLNLGITAEDSATPLAFATTQLEYGAEISFTVPFAGTPTSLTQLLDWLDSQIGEV